MARVTLNRVVPKRKSNAHKGDFGHVFFLAGSQGLTGAAYLCCQACVLSGSGLVTLGIPKSLNPIMAVKLTEAMTKPLAETKQFSPSLKAFAQINRILPQIDALAIGPGISRNPETQKLVHKLLLTATVPMALDADGINALAGNLRLLKQMKASLVITPHAGEMSRLLNTSAAEIQNNRLRTAKTFAKKHKVVVVLKGHCTVVANHDGQHYINLSGNPGMASGGCGDVLTGIIAAFLGQGFTPFAAAKLAVYVHGLAGDLAVKEKGEISLLASDILDKLAQAFRRISKR